MTKETSFKQRTSYTPKRDDESSSTHYIVTVEVKKNGILNNSSTYTSQPDPSSFTYTFYVDSTTGDTLSVTAIYIQGGSKTIEHVIKTTSDDHPSSTKTPGFEVIAVFCAVIGIVFWMRRK
jgi:hypothetical protein